VRAGPRRVRASGSTEGERAASVVVLLIVCAVWVLTQTTLSSDHAQLQRAPVGTKRARRQALEMLRIAPKQTTEAGLGNTGWARLARAAALARAHHARWESSRNG
jgi:hypothetical protein